MATTNIRLVPTQMRNEAKMQFDEGNVAALLETIPERDRMKFVLRNTGTLLQRGIYEQALACAFANSRTNFAACPPSAIRTAFERAERAKLLAAGDPLPPGDGFTVYRGVAGVRRQRRLPGPAWTDDLETAKGYARGGAAAGLPDPTVLVATVRREDVSYYSQNDRTFVAFVDKPKRLDVDLGGPAEGADRTTEPARESPVGVKRDRTAAERA